MKVWVLCDFVRHSCEACSFEAPEVLGVYDSFEKMEYAERVFRATEQLTTRMYYELELNQIDGKQLTTKGKT